MGLNEIVQSQGYKNFMKYLYGWGASVVLIGALFKLQHWPGAGIMLTVGMSTEAFIFFFSVFEPVHEEVDWSLVYPELAGIEGDAHSHKVSGPMEPAVLENVITSALGKANLGVAAGAGAGAGAASVQGGGSQSAFVFTEKFNEMLEKAEIGPDLFAKVGAGLGKLSDASNGIARIGDAVAATELFSKNMQRAGGAVGKFAESYEDSGAILSRTAQVLSQSLESTAATIDASGQDFSKGVQEVVAKLGANLQGAADSMSKGLAISAQELEGLNKSLAAMNSAHDSEVKSIQKRFADGEKLSASVEDMTKELLATVEESKKYGVAVRELSSNVSKLNGVYGNMLSAMGSVVDKK
ncbi:MAG: hypothetical protein CSA97_05210 [Bacteroidetes bacterium]|nr:MAG: hypothetical protein CSA97_05210 [Bacteroidota bacterium]